MKTVLFAGANGMLDNYLIRELLNQKFNVKVLVLADKKNKLLDQLPPFDLSRLSFVSEIKTAFHQTDVLISSLFFFQLNELYTFSKQDVNIALDLLEKAELANVSKIVWLARAPIFTRGDIKAIDYQGKINRVLATCRIPFTIVRPTLFFNELTIFYEQARKGKVYLPCYGQNKINPIYIGEFASICISSIYSDRKYKTVGGGEVFTCWEVLELMYKLLDQPPKISFISTVLYKSYISLCCLFQPDGKAALKRFKLRILTNDIIGRPVGKNALFDYFSEKVEQNLGISPNPYFKIGNYKEKRI